MEAYCLTPKEIIESFLLCMNLGSSTSPQSSMSTAKWQNIAGSKKFFTSSTLAKFNHFFKICVYKIDIVIHHLLTLATSIVE